MKKIILSSTAAIIALTAMQVGFADELTIPNTFTAGTPARAAEVNANFTAVEASVDDNAADIAANATDIATNAADVVATNTNVQANTSAIQSNTGAINALPLSAGLQVYSADDVRIGRLISLKDANRGVLLMQSDMGYLFESDIVGDKHLTGASSYHSEPNCAGTIYTFIGMEWAGTLGIVVRSEVDGQAYYWPRGSTPVQVTLLSQSHPDGSCQDGLSWTTIASAVIPNDESLTGVPNAKPSWPLKIGP